MSHPHHPANATIDGCRLVVVQDHPQACPYLDDQIGRMPLRLPVGDVTPAVVDWMLESGFRRSGSFVYKAECPACRECQPTRVDVNQFSMSRSMKRVYKRGEKELSAIWQDPVADPQRVALFNKHRNQRDLGRDHEQVSVDSYHSFLIDSCCDSRELAIFRDGQLIAVSIIDVGQHSMSAVYTHFDPKYEKFSLGTYAILKQFEFARAHGLKYVYLGMYVDENRHLNYKARYLPQERLIAGTWTAISSDCIVETADS